MKDKKKIKDILSNKESTISIETNLSIGSTLICIVVAILSLSLNIMAIPQLEGVFIKISSVVANINNNYSGILGFTGSFLGGCMVVLVFYLQKKADEKQGIKRLMFLLLSTYRTIKIFERDAILDEFKKIKKEFPNSSSNSSSNSFENMFSGLVYDKEWSKLVVYVSSYNDTEFLAKWFFSIEQVIILDKKSIDGQLHKIREILIKYGFKKYLYEVDKEIADKKDDKPVLAH